MGYCISQKKAHFIIKADNKADALRAVKNLKHEEQNLGHGGIYRGGQSIRNFMWMNNHDLSQAHSLEEMLKWWRYHTKVSHDGDIISISFQGEKLGDEQYLWMALAPFVESGSYIEMMGEDGDQWRWEFNNGEFAEVKGVVQWQR